MKIPRSASLRSLCFACLIGAASSVPQLLVAETTTTSPAADPYATAVRNYVDAASKEMAYARKELETAEKQGKKEAYAGARAVYEKCETLITRLKAGVRGEFDPTKAEYERTRATLQKKLLEARHAHAPIVPATPAPAATTTH